MILSAQTIRERFSDKIEPFHERTSFLGFSFGLSTCGYDIRIEFDKEGAQPTICLPPGDFILASSIERIKIPRDIVATVHDKSSWARRGLSVQNTVLEPNWQGFVTLELSNHGKEHLIIERGMPIAQVMFHLLDAPTEQPYSGKYQNQIRGPVCTLLEP
jgi:dCTP deaminase